MNRAVRRQQLKEPKGDKPGRAPRAMPSMSTAARAAKGQAAARRGIAPRWVMDIISELRKVVWPKREDVMHLTVVIVIVTILIGAALGLLDIAFGRLIDETILGR
jgi:preprotein translocase SecE subunit